MNPDYTHVSMLLDRSGSMAGIAADTIGGFNTFLADQKKQSGKMTLTLAQFDTEYDLLQNMTEIANVQPLSGTTFVPRGSTALYDSLDRLIRETGDALSKMDEKDRPGNVIFVILTDGEENASREVTRDMISAKLKHQTEQYNWHFVYIGANQDAFAVGNAMGNAAGSNIRYSATAQGMNATFSATSASIGTTRSTKKYRKLTQDDVDAAGGN